MEYTQRQLLKILLDELDTIENLVLKLYDNKTYDKEYLTRKVME